MTGGVEPGARDPLTDIIMRTFELNGAFLRAAESIARPAGLTPAWWLVLGVVLREPLSVAAAAREAGSTRQSVQRIADILVDRGFAEYRENPAHKRAKLLAPTADGLRAIESLGARQRAFVDRVTEGMDPERLAAARDVLDRISDAVRRDEESRPSS